MIVDFNNLGSDNSMELVNLIAFTGELFGECVMKQNGKYYWEVEGFNADKEENPLLIVLDLSGEEVRAEVHESLVSNEAYRKVYTFIGYATRHSVELSIMEMY